uniref:Glycosyltransferase n=1 Tax=Salix viminalis TaxID=40686 RepID=A0A6N2KC85_SALVM
MKEHKQKRERESHTMPSALSSHVVIFPFMAQGHTLPLLDLSKALSQQQIKVTIITTPSNAKSMAKTISNHPTISLVEIPFPTVDGLPKDCENTSQLPSMEFHLSFSPCHQTTPKALRASPTNHDFFLGWTLASCQAFGVPRLVFHGMGILSMSITKSTWFSCTTTGINGRSTYQDHDEMFYQFIQEVGEADAKSWGVVVNSFEELEKSHIPAFESFYINGAKAWCLGPLCLYGKMGSNKSTNQNHSCTSTQWLAEQVTPYSVIYVSFGTQADVSDSQLDEVAFALEESGFPFLWAVRSKTWSLPAGLEEKVKGRGLIVREWVDQSQILSHRAIGGFLSHCGWNSVLESVSAGVPVLAWPMIAEQSLNAKFLVDGLGAGISVKRVQNPVAKILVSRQDICEGVEELMGGSRGRSARERVQALGRVARRAVQKGGSSHDNLNKLIDKLRVSM